MDRRLIEVSEIIQGVGFRPFVYKLANQLGLNGFVRNRTGGVLIELEGDTPSLDRFLDELTTRPPPLARIQGVKWIPGSPRVDRHFRIEPSEVDRSDSIFIAPDIATCDDCLRELFDPADRRHRYPFLGRVRILLHSPSPPAYPGPELQPFARIAGYVAGGGPWMTSLAPAA